MSSTGEVVDHKARADASLALQAIHTHDRHCGERWAEARKAMESTNASIVVAANSASDSARRLHVRIDRMLWAVALGSLGIIANLVVNLLTMKN